jgi:hypothetical protein
VSRESSRDPAKNTDGGKEGGREGGRQAAREVGREKEKKLFTEGRTGIHNNLNIDRRRIEATCGGPADRPTDRATGGSALPLKLIKARQMAVTHVLGRGAEINFGFAEVR